MTMMLFLSLILLINPARLPALQQQQQQPSIWPVDFTFAQGQVAAACLQTFVEDLLARSSSDQESVSLAANRTLDQMLSQPHLKLALCRTNHVCGGCLNATVLDPRVPSCEPACKDSAHCELACKQLRRLAMNRPGDCPQVQDPRLCTTSCSSDLDCVQLAGSKCCNTGICFTCKLPEWTAPIIPPLPPSPTPTVVKDSASQHHLTWRQFQVATSTMSTTRSNVSNLLDPVVFVVQARYMVGPRFDSALAGDWLPLHVITTDFSLRMDDWRVGHVYQFRVAAVTARGTRGFGPASEPYTQSREPSPPNQPSNLSEGRMRVYSNGRISVQINWAPPRPSDLAVHLYQVTWTKDYGFISSDGAPVLSVTKFSKSIGATVRSYVIENLEPATSYKIEVRAVSIWGDRQLTGQPNSIYVSTLRASESQQQQQQQQQLQQQHQLKETEPSNQKVTLCLQRRGDDSKSSALPFNVIVTRSPIFERDGGLNIRLLINRSRDGPTSSPDGKESLVQWRSRVCIDTPDAGAGGRGSAARMLRVQEDREFSIDKLQFNCRYSIRITPLPAGSEARNVGLDHNRVESDFVPDDSTLEVCLITPRCSAVSLSTGDSPPACKTAADSATPGQPTDIRVELLPDSQPEQQLSYRISWRPPDSRSADPAAYSVEWGPRKEEPVSQEAYSRTGLQPQLDPDRAVSRVLGKDITSLIIRRLAPATVYIVKLRVHAYPNNQLTVGPEVEHFFTTANADTSILTSATQPSSAGGVFKHESLHLNQPSRQSEEVTRLVRVNLPNCGPVGSVNLFPFALSAVLFHWTNCRLVKFLIG